MRGCRVAPKTFRGLPKSPDTPAARCSQDTPPHCLKAPHGTAPPQRATPTAVPAGGPPRDLLLMELRAYVINNNLASTVPFALHEKMENNKNTTDTISTLQIQVDDVKNVMTKNIDKVLQREEKLSELVDRTDDLQIAADAFQKTSTKISRKMWWKNFKMIILIVVIFLIILTFIILLATGVIPT